MWGNAKGLDIHREFILEALILHGLHFSGGEFTSLFFLSSLLLGQTVCLGGTWVPFLDFFLILFGYSADLNRVMCIVR